MINILLTKHEEDQYIKSIMDHELYEIHVRIRGTTSVTRLHKIQKRFIIHYAKCKQIMPNYSYIPPITP